MIILVPIEYSPEQQAMLDNGLNPDISPDIDDNVSIEEVGLFEEDKWYRIKFFINEIKHIYILEEFLDYYEYLRGQMDTLGLLENGLGEQLDHLVGLINNFYHIA